MSMATVQVKVLRYEALLHAIQAAMAGSDDQRIHVLLGQVWDWSYAHRSGNGQISQAEQKRRIEAAFQKLGE